MNIIERMTKTVRIIISKGSFKNGMISIAAPNGVATKENPKRYFGNAILAAVIPPHRIFSY